MRNLLMLTALCALICSAGCASHKEKQEAESHYLATTPLKIDTAIVKDYVCQIRSIRHIELRALERGYLQSIYVDEGQFLKKGQLLFRIMPKLYEAEVQKAEAEVKLSEIEYQNTKSLVDKNIVSPNELAMAKARLNKVKSELTLAETHLGFTEIRAPFDGYIDRFRVRLGSLVAEGDLLTTLSDNSQLWVYFNVPEAEYLDYKKNHGTEKTPVSLMLANNELYPHAGVIETIEADFDNETGNISFRATFPNPDGLLRHGETGNIRMKQPVVGGLIIPQKATFEILDKKYVFVIGKDDKVQSREITVGGDIEDLFIVISGLAENEKILLEGLRKVKEGDKVRYEYQAPQTVMARLKMPAE